MFAMYVPFRDEPIHLFRTVEDSIEYCKKIYFTQMVEEFDSFNATDHSIKEIEKFVIDMNNLYNSYLKEVDDTYELFKQEKQDWFGNLKWFYIKEIEI